MLEEVFQEVYTKFKLHFYQSVFQRFATREATLTTVESFCMEGIMAMGEPTIAEFSRMMGISTPNAAYKIGSLVRKGYVEKIQSTVDRREYHLRPTQKYINYYNISYSYLHTVIERARERFSPEDCKKLEEMLSVVSHELMPEMDMLTRVFSMMSSMNYIVFVIIGCAGALAFVVLYNLNNINITERIREIATIKVLGFYKKETASYVFRENMALTAVGCAVGLILGRLLHMYVMSRINVDMISFDEKVKGISYLLSILLTFFFNWTVNRMMSGKLEKINMAESLKSVD